MQTAMAIMDKFKRNIRESFRTCFEEELKKACPDGEPLSVDAAVAAFEKACDAAFEKQMPSVTNKHQG